jgi:hypothetical protein
MAFKMRCGEHWMTQVWKSISGLESMNDMWVLTVASPVAKTHLIG